MKWNIDHHKNNNQLGKQVILQIQRESLPRSIEAQDGGWSLDTHKLPRLLLKLIPKQKDWDSLIPNLFKELRARPLSIGKVYVGD